MNFRHSIWCFVLCTIFTALGAKAQSEIVIDDNTIDASSVIYDGIDVSNYQRDIDWRATAKDKNIKFVYVKATEGANHKQHRYIYNIENARKHGIKVGSYHFFRTTSSVESQFRNFISIVKPEDQDLVPLIDVETRKGWTGEQLADSVKLFADMLEEYYGCKPMIYTGASFYNSFLSRTLKGYKLFIARYSKSEPRLNDAKWTLWQFSERGRIAGIDHYVDLSRFNKGCGLKDILIKDNSTGKRKNRNVMGEVKDVPPPRKVQVDEKQEVPMSAKQRERLRKEQEKAEKEAKKRAEKEAKEKKKEQERIKKQREEQEKRQRELLKKQQKEQQEKLKQEQERKEKLERERQERLEKDRKEKAKKEHLEKEERARKQAEQQKRIEELEKKKAADEKKRASEKKKAALAEKYNKTSANQQNVNKGKKINQSSADND